MELILSIAGITLTVLLSAPVLNSVAKRRKDAQRREQWSAKLHFDEGVIQDRQEYAFERWEEIIEVDERGYGKHTRNVTIANRSKNLISSFFFPAFCDRKNIRIEELEPWITEKQIASISVDEWNEEKSRGRFKVAPSEPLKPASRTSFKFGYTLPALFSEGDEYYSYAIANPMYSFDVTFEFDPTWSVQYARWSGPAAAALEAPRYSENSISGCVMFPRISEHLKLEFGLAKKKENPSNNISNRTENTSVLN